VSRTSGLARKILVQSTWAVILAAGWVTVLVAIPDFLRALPGAPREFWVLLVVALLAEVAPLVIPHEHRRPTKLAASLSLTFAMLLLFGPAVAIVVQTLSLGVAQLRLPRPWAFFALDVARYSIAFTVTDWVVASAGHAPVAVGMVLTEPDLRTILVAALVWFLVDVGLIVVLIAVSGPATWRVWVGPPLYYYMAASAGLLMFAPVLVTAQTGWMLAFVAVPLALLGLISRVLLTYEQTLNVDLVTRLRSEYGLSTAVDDILNRAPLSSAEHLLGFLHIRIGGLGEITNAFGRQVTGDLIEQIGARINAATSAAGSVVGRIAAADFAVVLPGADTVQAERDAGALAHALTAPFEIHGVVFSVQPRIGVAIAPADGSDLEELTARTETAIMDGRQSGSPVRVVQNRDELEAQRRLELLVDLRAAIDGSEHAGELFVLYQPQVRISDGQLVGVEALVRWRHPDRGLVDTADMIMVAEASNVIGLLTFRIIDDVLAQLAVWSAAGLQLKASINVSAKDVASEGFARELGRSLALHSIAPGQIELEITETVLVESTPTVDRVVADLVAMGVGLSLDDFGTGYASLQQIRRYPLRELKIDRSYIATTATNAADRAVVTSISRLATELGLRVVAEGVEDEATSIALGEIGPLIGQGWYYGHPMNAVDLVDWIDARRPAA